MSKSVVLSFFFCFSWANKASVFLVFNSKLGLQTASAIFKAVNLQLLFTGGAHGEVSFDLM